MASSRRLPVSYNVHTYGDATRDYTSLAAWEADTDNDLVTAAKGEVLECYADSASFDDTVDIGDATTNADYFRVIKPAAGQGHDGTASAGVKFTKTGNVLNYLIRIKEGYSQIQDLIGTCSFNNSLVSKVFVIYDSTSTAGIIGCITYGATNSGTGQAHGTKVSGGFAVNCLSYKNANSGFFAADYALRLYNCTAAYNTGAGFLTSLSGAVAKNCVSESNTGVEWSGTWTKTTCTDDSGVIFADSANDNYHLDPTDTVAKDQGTDLSSDSSYAFDDDIDGNTRSGTWDIGADEYLSAVTHTQGILLDALIQTTGLATASVDALVQTINIDTLDLDALLQQPGVPVEAVLDALISMPGITSTASLDAYLQARQSVSAFVDALVQQSGVAKAALLDALLQNTDTASVAMDAIIQAAAAYPNTSIDAIVARNDNIVSAAFDACLQSEQSRAAAIDALLQVSGQAASSLLDGVLVRQADISTVIDALVALHAFNDVSLDAVIFNSPYAAASMDAVIRESGYTISETRFVDAPGRVFGVDAPPRIFETDAPCRVKHLDS